ncbi:hypothetical protein [Pseudomonas brassicacearum]|nr:hypothetical protein [Pseudomonas brassicacearum]
MPIVPSPATPNTPPAGQKPRSTSVFPRVESPQASSSNASAPPPRAAPAIAPKPTAFLVPKLCVVCKSNHQGPCLTQPPSAASTSSQKPASALDMYEQHQTNYQPQNRTQPFEIMQSVTDDSLKFSDKKATDAELAKVADKKFTLRHYTTSKDGPPPFNTISSNFELVHRKIKTLQRTQGSNTNQDDWVRLGNTAFTFFLLAIDGEVANRKFLGGATHYAEIDPDNLEQMTAAGLENAEFFASPDLLHTKDLSSAKAIKGPLKDLKALMVASSGLKAISLGRTPAQGLLKAIDGQFADTLEVKLPGSVIVTQWHTI